MVRGAITWLFAAFGLVVLALVFSACPGGPGPQPTPTPSPPEVRFQDMLLRVAAPNAFQTINGEPVDFVGAISCCKPADWDANAESGWPVNIHPSWQEYAADAFGANAFHARLGPFMTAAEPEWSEIGGAYLEIDGKADLTQWNDRYWTTVKQWVEYAGERGRYVEIDLIDGWYCKHGIWGNVQVPWMAQFNIQGEDHIQQCSARAIQPEDVFDNWLRKVVTELGVYGNVIWLDGNEIGITGRYVPEWSLSMRDRVRYFEQEYAYNMVHIFGTNSSHDEVRPQVDYIEEHATVPLTAPIANRPSMINEYNPNPAFGPVQMNDNRCFSERNGTWWWYWRHSQSYDQMEKTAALWRQGCGAGPQPTPPPPSECGFPQGIPNDDFTGVENPGSYGSVVNKVMAELSGCAVGTDCPITFHPDLWMALVCGELCDLGVNCGRHDNEPPGASDQISVTRGSFCDGTRHENYSVYNYGGKKVRWAPGGTQDAWIVNPNTPACQAGPQPTPPPPSSDCAKPDSCGEHFQLAYHQGVIDSTYTVNGCCDYCAEIGLPCMPGTGPEPPCTPRCGCPILPEGHPDRTEEERKCIGVQKWWCNDIQLEPCGATRNPNCITANPAQAICNGHVKTCTEWMTGCSEGDF